MGRVGEELGATLEIALNAGYGIRDTGYGQEKLGRLEFPKRARGQGTP